MYPVERALWFIENRLDADISLRAIADSAGVSAHHLARAFAGATGSSLMRYARGRRLSEAARSLAAGAPDILAVALAAGYGSHEAFTRAFGEQFGMTPEECRSIGKLDHLKLVEPIRMDKSLLIDLDEPRFAESGEILIAGLGARYTFATNQGIPTNGSGLRRTSETLQIKRGQKPTASAATPTTPATSNTSPASRSGTSVICLTTSQRCGSVRSAMPSSVILATCPC